MAGAVFPSEAEIDELVLGPDSVAWQITSDVRLNFALLYPLLLQVAHPTVDAGVADHSDFEGHPWDRLLRTADYVNLLVYGGRDAAVAGRRLRALHRRFRGFRDDGERYSALEPDAYVWVHATLLDTYVRATARFGRPLCPTDTDRFYREYRGLGRLIGIRERDLPPTYRQFLAYFRRTARTKLERTGSVERVLEAMPNIATPPRPMPQVAWRALRIPAWRVAWLGGIGLMDSDLRRRLQIGWNPVDEAQFRALGTASRGLGMVLPASFKVTGPGHLRWRSREIAGGPLGEVARTTLPAC